MVLRAAGARGLDLRTLRTAAGTRSVWTVDLAHLLSAFGRGGSVRQQQPGEAHGAPPPPAPVFSAITLTTTWAGANPAYAGEAFYAATLEADRVRVGALFAGAPAAGVAVETRRVPSAELGGRLMGGRTAIIALVDKSILAAGVRAGGEAEKAAAAAAASPPSPSSSLRAPPPPTTPDLSPSAASPLAAQAPPLSPMAAASSGRSSPRLARRRRLSSSSGGGSAGPDALATASPSASPEPTAGPSPGGPLLTAEPPLPAGWEAAHQPGWARRGYLGHYVVLSGYDPSTRTFSVRDPAGGAGDAVAVPGAALDAARWAWGTDEDLLLVELAG